MAKNQQIWFFGKNYESNVLDSVNWHYSFFNGLINTFVADDLGQIVGNPYVHSLSFVPIFFSSSTFFNGSAASLIGNYYRPLVLTVFTILYTAFGSNYFFFHLFQLLIHLLNTILVFLFFQKFFKKPLSFFLSLLFLVHPIQSEAVLYISDVQEVLFFFFGMVALLIIQKSYSYKTNILAWICILLSLLSKETGILFVITIMVYMYIFVKKQFMRNFLSGCTITVLYIVLRIHAIGIFSTPKDSSISQLTLLVRVIQIPNIIFFYLRTFIFPLNLSVSYQWIYFHIDLLHFWFPLLIDLLFFGVVFFFALYLYKMATRTIFFTFAFFSIWFVDGLALHLQIIPLDATVGERWFYFPIVGLVGMIGVLFEIFHINQKNIWVLGGMTLIIFVFATRTFIRTFDFRDEMTLALHDSRVSPEAYNLQNILSFSYFQLGQYAKAQGFAEESVRLHPFMTTYLNLGAAYFAEGKYLQAKKAFLTSLTYGDFYQTYDNLALLALSYGNPKENITFIKTVALRKYPQDGRLWLYLAALEYNFGSITDAKNDVQQAYILDPEEKVVAAYNAIMNNKPVRIGLRK